MIKKAIELISKEDAKSFSISTIIPKDWLIKEEDVWDKKIAKETESIKNYLNRHIVNSLKETKLRYLADGDCRLRFDYKKGEVELELNELFIFGRYKKHKTGLSQSRWICTECNGKGCKRCDGKGKNYESVEEKIGEPVKRATTAEDYVMHASGREDVDATNSAGRAFVLEIKKPKIRNLDLNEMKKKIDSKEVSVIDLEIVTRGFTEIVTESHFDKTYRAEALFGKEVDKKVIEALSGKTLLQRTPTRVAHRRADLVRHRKVKKVKVVEVQKNKAVLEIKAEAGTYIKEFISGDNGRTNPSIAGILSTSAECKSLDVVETDDEYINFVRRSRMS